jgi:hypothetical protein
MTTAQPIATVRDTDLPVLMDLLTKITNVEASSPEAWEVWLDVFSDTSVATATAAIKAFARNSSHFPSPANVREYVDEMHRDRLGNLAIPGFPPDLGQFQSEDEFNQAYLRWTQTWRQQIKLGATVEDADEIALAAIGLALDRNIERSIPMPEITSVTGLRVITTGGAR